MMSMKYLFDNNSISDLYDNKSKRHHSIIKRLNLLGNEDNVVISVVTFYELEYAYANAPDEKKVVIRNDIIHLKNNFEVIPLSIESAEMFGVLKKKFKESRMISKENIKKHNIDIMLASCAICGGYILVSADKIFPSLNRLIEDFYFENWTL